MTSRFHGLHGGWDIAMACKKNDGNLQSDLGALDFKLVVSPAKICLGALPKRAEPRQERSERSKNDEIWDLGSVNVDGVDRLDEVPFLR